MVVFEVVGLVLAVLPLLPLTKDLLQSLTLGPGFSRRMYHESLMRVDADIKFLESSIGSIFNIILSNLAFYADSRDDLFRNPAQLLERRYLAVDDRLRLWLGSRHDPFCVFTASARKRLNRVGSALDPKNSSLKRLSFCLLGTWKSVIKDIDEDLERIRQLISDNLEDHRISSERDGFLHDQRVQSTRKHFHTILELVVNSWGCECRSMHYAKVDIAPKRSSLFGLGMAVMQGPNLPATWQYRDISVREKQDDSSPVEYDREPEESAAASLHSSEPTSPPLKGKRKSSGSEKKNIDHGALSWMRAFREPKITGADDQRRSVAELKGVMNLETEVMGLEETMRSSLAMQEDSGCRLITDLCHTLEEGSAECLGFFERDGRQYCVLQSMNPETGDSNHFMALKSILGSSGVRSGKRKEECSSSQVEGNPRGISRKVRAQLALVIAESELTLNVGMILPWNWSSSIVFQASTSERDNLNKPRVHLSFDKSADMLPKIEKQIQALESLGILLLELCFWESIEEHKKQQTWLSQLSGAASIELDRAFARMWQDSVLEEAGHHYHSAVRWCLEARVNVMSLGEEELQKEMWERVVRPLEMHSKQFSRNVCD